MYHRFFLSATNSKAMSSSNTSTSELVGHWPLNGNLSDVSILGNDGKMITPLGSMAFAPVRSYFTFTDFNNYSYIE